MIPPLQTHTNVDPTDETPVSPKFGEVAVILADDGRVRFETGPIAIEEGSIISPAFRAAYGLLALLINPHPEMWEILAGEGGELFLDGVKEQAQAQFPRH